jgi:UDP-3-O-[3-hydroxymyristoyl] N-acetylglucosamine deacetylase
MFQKTLKKEISFMGIGLHSAKKINVKLKPAQPNTGIVFVVNGEQIKSNGNLVKETQLCTGLNNGVVSLNTIEHFLFSLFYYSIDNIVVELNANEMPILDGSAMPFLYLIRSAGIKKQKVFKKIVKIKKEIVINYEDKYIIAKPSDTPSLNLTIDFEHQSINSQSLLLNLNNINLLDKISRARTFGFMSDIEYLRNNNLALGGSFSNAVILDEYRILNPEGLRMEEEFIYHKVLDFLGDIYINGMPIIANIEGYKTGHHINNLFIRELFSSEENYEIVTLKPEKEKNTFISSLNPIFS